MASNQTLTISAQIRKPGKATSRSLRMERMIPAVAYGPKTENFSFAIGENDAVRCSRHGFENTIFTLSSDDKNLDGLKILRKDIDVHPVSRRPIHMDFFVPDMTQTVRVEVEVRLVGKAPGVVEGGIVSQVKREVEIETLPLEIPEYFELDISNLQLNESLHVSDIVFPTGVKLISGEKETIVSCAEVEEEAATPVAAASETEAAAAPAAGDKAGDKK